MNGSQVDFMRFLRIALSTSGRGRLYVPFKAPSSASEVTFTGFGINAAGDVFSKGWQLIIQNTSQARFFKTFCTGTLSYNANATSNRIVLRNGDVLGQLVRQDSLPDWFPVPHYIIYENVDEAKTLTILTNYLNNHPQTVNAINDQLSSTNTVADIITMFANDTLTMGIPVPAGEIVGEAASDGAASLKLSIYMQHELDNTEGLYLDPAIYHHHWAEYIHDLSGHTLESNCKKIFAGPIANGIVRYVASGGGSAGPFTDPSLPANLLSTAIGGAGQFDTIIVMDTATYSESSEIEIDKPLNITALGNSDVRLVASPNLPAFDGSNTQRVLRVHDISGIVSICNVIIKNGRATGSSTGPKGGGGILIENAHGTYIRNCYIHNNATNSGATEDGFGGGVYIYHSSAFVFHNRVSNNTSAERGGGIGIWGYGWPIIEDNKIDGNRARGGGRPDGGGIGVETAYPDDLDFLDVFDLPSGWTDEKLRQAMQRRIHFIKNHIHVNTSDDDGGGIYLSVLARAKFIENEIFENNAGNAGGGVRFTLASDVIMRGDYIHTNRSNTNHVSGNGGGGIAVRNSTLNMVNVRILGNECEGWAGGGIFFNSTSSGSALPFISYDDILRQVFRATSFELSISGDQTVIQNNNARYVAALGDHRLGGGVYVLRFQDTSFTSLPLRVFIQDITLINGNNLDPVPLPIAHTNSVELHVEDMVHRRGTPIDDSNKGTFTTNNQFIYNSS